MFLFALPIKGTFIDANFVIAIQMIVLTKPIQGSSDLAWTIAEFFHIFCFMMAQYRKLMVVGNPWKNFTQLYEIIRNYCVHCGLCMVMSSVENNPCAVCVYTDHAHFYFRQAL
jgi:hypothetical protein